MDHNSKESDEILEANACPACIQLQDEYSTSDSTILQFPASKPISWGDTRPNCDLGYYLSGLENIWKDWTRSDVNLPYRSAGTMCLWNGEQYELCREKGMNHLGPLIISQYNRDDAGSSHWPPVKSEVIPDFKSESSMARLQGWLQICDTEPSHNICQQSSVFMPSRVIDTADALEQQTVKLVETTGMQADYIALSHFWGTSQRFLNTKSTIDEARSGISISLLPETFRDAIWLTSKLGKRYLWIDSLCIVQDDENDWLVESRQMRHIYWNSYLTVAASNARDDNDGFLQSFKIGELIEIVLNLPSGASRRIYIQSTNARSRYVIESGELPLDSRGWTLQERLLPHRAVRYGTMSMEWACRYQDGPATGIWNDFWHLRTHLHWRRMIEQYTRRSLTYERDKLPAISGLAEMFADTTKNKYCAGLWWEGLAEDLLWTKGSGILTKPKDRNGPSWSWASVDGPIDFVMTKNNPMTVAYESTFIDSDIKLNTQNPYGEVESGTITLEGPLRPLKVIFPEKHGVGRFGYQKEWFDFEKLISEEVFELDILRNTDSIRSDVPGVEGPVVSYSLISLLIVKLTSNPDTFARVGLCRTDTDSRFERSLAASRLRIVLV